MKDKAVFLDRDGVLNEVVYHEEMGILDSPFTAEQFKLLPDVGKTINKFHELGFKVIIVSNQPGIAKDHHTMETFQEIQNKMKKELMKDNAEVDGEYYCFHHPDGKIKEYTMVCDCRKPKPGLIIKAAEEQDIDIDKSWMIGDGITDIQAGHNAGCRTILIGRMKCDLCRLMEDEKVKPDFIVPNLYKASIIIGKEQR